MIDFIKMDQLVRGRNLLVLSELSVDDLILDPVANLQKQGFTAVKRAVHVESPPSNILWLYSHVYNYICR
ncbi:hypothetical protein D1872_339900 [compost metagenome]